MSPIDLNEEFLCAFVMMLMIFAMVIIFCRFSIAFKEKYKKLQYQKSLQKEAEERRRKAQEDIEKIMEKYAI